MTHILSENDLIGGRYKIEGYQDAGGMQEVYRAHDQALLRTVALKVPKNDSATKRFARSAAMSAKVTHPNVAKTLDYLAEGKRQFLIEEFVEGQDLRSRLGSHFFYLDPHLAAHVFHHLTKGLAAVHRVGVVHRDLKPSNIIVSTDPDVETVKITDFGIAKMAEAEMAEGLKDIESTMASATIVGALPYMAPEVIRNTADVTQSADVWSVGAVLFQLLTGDRPFGDGFPAVEKILKGELPSKPPMLVRNGQFNQLADELWSLICKCLNPNAADRPSADDLVQMCGTLCYSRAPRCIGTIYRYGGNPGSWGFVSCGGSEDDAFFHVDSFWGDKPEVGARVSLAKFPGTPSPRAHPVLLLRPD
jgi:serine/threonine protein kinase